MKEDIYEVRGALKSVIVYYMPKPGILHRTKATLFRKVWLALFGLHSFESMVCMDTGLWLSNVNSPNALQPR